MPIKERSVSLYAKGFEAAAVHELNSGCNEEICSLFHQNKKL